MKNYLLFACLINFLFCACESEESKDDPVCILPYCMDTISENESDLVNYPVIDIHQHIYSATGYWGGDKHPSGLESPYTAKDHYARLVRKMKENNVVLGIAATDALTCVEYYDQYPENNELLWYGVSLIKPANGIFIYDDPPLNFSDLVKSRKIRAIGELLNIYLGIPHDDNIYQQLYAYADTFSLAVNIHTGIVPSSILENYPDYSYEYANPASLKPMLEKYPNVNFEAAHGGVSNDEDYNFEEETLAMMDNYENFYVDISPIWWNPSETEDAENFISKAIKRGLEDKILYGSDEMVWPDAIPVSINFFKTADFLTVQQKKKIIYWNNARYLKLSDEEVTKHFSN